jgi:hypothetical protein
MMLRRVLKESVLTLEAISKRQPLTDTNVLRGTDSDKIEIVLA